MIIYKINDWMSKAGSGSVAHRKEYMVRKQS
jgi:hypothetical protein